MGFGEIVAFAKNRLGWQQYEAAAQPPRATETLGEVGLLGEGVQKPDDDGVNLADRVRARNSMEAELRQQGWM
jgi:hypothetical protein